MEIVLRKAFKVSDEVTIKKVISVSACILAIFDTYSDISTIANLYNFGNDEYLCTYSCSSFLATVLLLIVIISVLFQARVFVNDTFYGSRNQRYFYAFAALWGFGTIPVLYSIWDKLGDEKIYGRFFRMRWLETTKEALPAAAVQIIVLIFFSGLVSTATSEVSLFETYGFFQTLIVIFSIVTSLVSVGNNTRKYLTYTSQQKARKLAKGSKEININIDSNTGTPATPASPPNQETEVSVFCFILILYSVIRFVWI